MPNDWCDGISKYCNESATTHIVYMIDGTKRVEKRLCTKHGGDLLFAIQTRSNWAILGQRDL